ncbi:MAG: UDP-N-acetylmuramate:L-alanyl-gamma-D-glutamyl-meso-diaminopimelate ligase, partial [Candidatus Binataceae bacterium]
RILTALEPRTNTARRNVFQAEFAAAFDRAARVYLAPVYFKDNDPIPAGGRLSVEDLAADIGRRGPAAFACASTDDILARMLADARPGDVALIMSNGPFDNLKERLLAALSKTSY